jgi:hypothetical protein
MEYLFRILFGKGVVTPIAAVLLFTTPKITTDGTSVLISGTLKGIFTSRVERIIHTGTELSITYDLSLVFADGNSRVLENRKVKHSIRYNDLEKEYLCVVDGESMKVKDENSAYRLMENYRIRIPRRKAGAAKRMDLYIEASIDYSSSLQVDVPDNMLWEYYIPNKKIRNIRLGD